MKKKEIEREEKQNKLLKYLSTTKISNNNPIICLDSKNIIFSNGISIYMVNPEYFKLNNYKFMLPSVNKNFKIVSFNKLNDYFKKVNTLYGKTELSCDLYECFDVVTAQWVNFDGLNQENFNQEEIDYCNEILNNPIYKISEKNPILKAESEVGKAYILGMKKY